MLSNLNSITLPMTYLLSPRHIYQTTYRLSPLHAQGHWPFGMLQTEFVICSPPLRPSRLLGVRNGTSIRAQALSPSLPHPQVQQIPNALSSTCYMASQSTRLSRARPSPGRREHRLLDGLSDTSSLGSQLPGSMRSDSVSRLYSESWS